MSELGVDFPGEFRYQIHTCMGSYKGKCLKNARFFMLFLLWCYVDSGMLKNFGNPLYFTGQNQTYDFCFVGKVCLDSAITVCF